MLEKLVHVEEMRDEGDSFESTNRVACYSTAPADSRKYGLDSPSRKLEHQVIKEQLKGERTTFLLGPDRPHVSMAGQYESTVLKSIIIQNPPHIENIQLRPGLMVVEYGLNLEYNRSVFGQPNFPFENAERIKSPDPARFGKKVKFNSGEQATIHSMDFAQGFTGLRELIKKHRPKDIVLLVDPAWRYQIKAAVEMGYPKPTQTYPVLKVLEGSQAPMFCGDIRHASRLIGTDGDNASSGLLKRSRKFDSVWETLSVLHQHGYILRSKGDRPRFNLISEEPVDSLCKTIEQKFVERRKDCAKLARLLKKGDRVTIDDYDRLEKGLRFLNTTSTQQTSEQV